MRATPMRGTLRPWTPRASPTSYVAGSRSVNHQGEGNLHQRSAFVYDPASDSFTRPADQRFVSRHMHEEALQASASRLAAQPG